MAKNSAPDDELPDWLNETSTLPPSSSPAADPTEPVEDDFERLRQRATAESETYQTLEEPTETRVGVGGFLSSLSPAQRLILAVLFLLNILAIGCGLLVVLNIVTF